MERLRALAAQLAERLDGLDLLTIYSVLMLCVGLTIVFGIGVALIVHGVLGIAFVALATMRSEQAVGPQRGG